MPSSVAGQASVLHQQGRETSHQVLARVAVGKGIKHRFSIHQADSAAAAQGRDGNSTGVDRIDPSEQSMLSALADNFQSSLQEQRMPKHISGMQVAVTGSHQNLQQRQQHQQQARLQVLEHAQERSEITTTTASPTTTPKTFRREISEAARRGQHA